MRAAETLAREVADEYLSHHSPLGILEARILAALKAHEATVRADEREACAKEADEDEVAERHGSFARVAAKGIARRIRARGAR